MTQMRGFFARQAQSVVHPRGFTLLEVLAVLMIMALMVGLAGYNLHGVLHRATHQQAMDAFIAFDAASRDRASRRGRPITLHFEARRITAVWQTPERGDPNLRAGVFPTGYHFEMRLLGATSGTSAQNQLTINAQGRSPSYRIKVEAPGGMTRWIVICGLSGQAKVFENESSVDDISALALAAGLPR